MIRLSQRLQRMADLVIPGGVIADIGTDHGHLPIWLFEHEICPGVILTDISEDSLSKAKGYAGAFQFGGAVSFRVGDGLAVLAPSEAETVVIAGMGGKLIRDIMAEDPAHTATFRRFILQPRTASGSLRKYLLEQGFLFLHDDVVKEGHFLPEIITVETPARTDAADGENGADGDPVADRGAGADAGSGSCVPMDLAADSRQKLQTLEEDDIRLRVPPWILEGEGPVDAYLQRRMQQERRVLEQIRRARNRNAAAETKLLKNIAWLQKLQKELEGKNEI